MDSWKTKLPNHRISVNIGGSPELHSSREDHNEGLDLLAGPLNLNREHLKRTLVYG